MSCTGLVIFDIESMEHVVITSVKPNPNKTHGLRLHDIREHIKSYMKDFPPYEIAIERGFSHMNNTTQVIYRVHGIINELLYQCEQFYYPPTTVKKTITGSGKAKKNELQEHILEKYPEVKFLNNDESDAFAVGLTHLIKEYGMDLGK